MMSVEVSSKSAPGSSHAYEDRILVDEARRLYAVADGVTVSTQGSGAVAAERSLTLLRELFAGDLSAAVGAVHKKFVELRREDRTVGETTLTAAHVGELAAEIVNVGDSPGYLLRDGELRVLTHPDRSELGYITQVIGYPERITVHGSTVNLRKDDYVILASDGVAHVLNHATLLPMAAAARSSKDIVETIIDRAKVIWTGYDDDKSVIVIKVLDESSHG